MQQVSLGRCLPVASQRSRVCRHRRPYIVPINLPTYVSSIINTNWRRPGSGLTDHYRDWAALLCLKRLDFSHPVPVQYHRRSVWYMLRSCTYCVARMMLNAGLPKWPPRPWPGSQSYQPRGEPPARCVGAPSPHPSHLRPTSVRPNSSPHAEHLMALSRIVLFSISRPRTYGLTRCQQARLKRRTPGLNKIRSRAIHLASPFSELLVRFPSW